MMNFISKKFLGVMVALAIFALPALAEVEVGVDAVSKYVMRGTAVGSGVALQPSVDYTLGGGGGGLFAEGGTTVGLWGSYSLVNGSNDEIKIHLSQGLGFATLSVTDYYYPVAAGTGAGNSFFEFADDGGHALEVGLSVDVANGSLFVGALRTGGIRNTGHLERLVFNEAGEERWREWLLGDLRQRIRDVRQGPDGLLYVLTDADEAALLKLEPVD